MSETEKFRNKGNIFREAMPVSLCHTGSTQPPPTAAIH